MLKAIERLKKGERVVIVCAGDSITQQNYHVNGYLNYVGHLDEKFPNARIINAGVSGDTTDDFLDRFDMDVRQFAPDFVTVMFGCNDAGLGKDNLPQFRNNLLRISQLIEEVGAEMIFLTQNPLMLSVNEEPAVKRYAYNEYVECIRDFTKTHEIPLCDINLAWENYIKKYPNKAWGMMSDALHPNERGQRFIAEAIFDYLQIERIG